MAKFNIEKLKEQLSELNVDDLYEVYKDIKAYVNNRLTEEQVWVENRANELQQRIDRLNEIH